MFTRISSITLASLLFLLLLGSQGHFFVLIASIVVLVFASVAVNFKRLNFTWPHLLLPAIYLIGAGSVYAVIPSNTIRLIYLGTTAITFYFLEMSLGHESHFLQNIFLISVLAWYIGLFALVFYINFSAIWLVLLVFIATYIFGLQGFAGFSLPAKKYFYLILSLICAETAWGLSFWPTHFFVDAVVLFSVFYLIWLFAFSAFFGKLSPQKIYWQLTLIAIVLILTLSTAAWRPLR